MRLHAFVLYVSYVPSFFTCFRALRAFMPYQLSCFTRFRTLRALFARFIYAPCVHFSSALYFFSSIFQVLKIFLGQICSPGETSHFSRTGKEATNRAIFMWVTKQP